MFCKLLLSSLAGIVLGFSALMLARADESVMQAPHAVDPRPRPAVIIGPYPTALEAVREARKYCNGHPGYVPGLPQRFGVGWVVWVQ